MADLNKFWRFIESALYCKVPEYLKVLLRLQGFDSVVAIKELDDVDIQCMDGFVRKSDSYAYRDIGDITDYYVYSDEFLKQFEVLRGHRRLLKAIAAFVTQQVNANGLDSFMAQCLNFDLKKTQGNYFVLQSFWNQYFTSAVSS